MHFRDHKRRQTTGINITPLIDIVFILLIFFAVTTTFVAPTSIKVDLPNAKGEANQEKKNVRIGVDNAGALFIDGVPIADDMLAAEFQKLAATSPDITIIIEADKSAMHGKVVFVIDKARSANLTKFAIATDEAN